MENNLDKTIKKINKGNLEGDINEECLEFFRRTPGFHRLLAAIKEKYRSLGSISGTVLLKNLKEEEKIALTGLLRRDYLKQSQATIKISKVTEALQKTKYQEADLLEVLQLYWGKNFLSKKEELAMLLEERQLYFAELDSRLVGEAKDWLKELVDKKNNAYKIIMTRYEEDRISLGKDLEMVSLALEKLPVLTGETMQLPLFSSLVTSDPHYFDSNTPAGQLLIYALSHMYSLNKPSSAAQEAELFYKGGLYGTEITNSTVCCGLFGYLDDKKIHPGWLGFYENCEALQISLGNLNLIKKIKSPSGFVLVVENPSVFSVLSQRAKEEYGYPLPLVCANGQVNLATLALLDCLISEETILYYAGDFDPEGLLIANRLKKRYPQLGLLCYGDDDYRAALSNQRLSQKRLQQLKRLEDKKLIQIGNLMKEIGYAGYQEVIIDNLWTKAKSLLEKYYL